MVTRNLVASFEVRCLNKSGKDYVQLVIHGDKVVAESVEANTLYEKLFDTVKSKIENAKSSKPQDKKTAKKVAPKSKKTTKKSNDDDDDWDLFGHIK